MKIGFIITKTPQEEGFNNFITLLNIYQAHSEIIIYLIGNGVYGGVHGHVHADLIHFLAENHSVSISENDLNARGLDSENLIHKVKLFQNYDDLVVDLMEEMDQVFSF
jgi:tRNA 2-thiouridine synthesizing protein B